MYSLAFLYMYNINMGSEDFRSHVTLIQRKALGVQNTGRILKEGTVSEPQSATKLVETLCPKGAF